jgi:hypothetical protein
MHKGFTIMPSGARRTQLMQAIDTLVPARFQDRIPRLTRSIVARQGILEGHRQLAGRPLNAPDGMIAATALEHNPAIVTRKVKGFAGLGVTLFNPGD